ncbi:hypothetical protein IT404_04380 [Candidatus Nomurabacteria bacterium]|nr:hypothetical protein [Candidatus Nomurabacteria bacterium]
MCDAEPPYHPRACVAQAWSATEVLRAWQKTPGSPPDLLQGSVTS